MTAEMALAILAGILGGSLVGALPAYADRLVAGLADILVQLVRR